MLTAHSSLLATLEPIAALSPGRVSELANMCVVESVSRGLDPFRMNVVRNEQLFYLLKGDLSLELADGQSVLLRGGSEAARRPVIANQLPLKEATALSDLQILRIDADLLDIMLTWDQLAGYEKGADKSAKQERNAGEWMDSTGVFSAESLKNGIFSALPPANVEEMFRRLERVPVITGQIIILQGAVGDYYYLIESGTARVSRVDGINLLPQTVAELKAGDAFGEEALVSDNKRNASVTMKTEGVLLRLGKQDFIDLLKKPLLKKISLEEAINKIQFGTILCDVRTPSEFGFKHISGAMSMPLHDIRDAIKGLDKSHEYITYCQTGRRASAAAFVLAQHGFKVMAISFA